MTVPPPSSAKLAKQLGAAMAAIHRRGWCEGTGGNFSCVLQRQPLQLLMAPSGVDKGSVSPEQLIVVDERGEVLRDSGRASAETELHLALVQTCGAGAVLHTHSQAGTLLSQWALEHWKCSKGWRGSAVTPPGWLSPYWTTTRICVACAQ